MKLFEINHPKGIIAEFHNEGLNYYFIIMKSGIQVFKSINYLTPGKAVNIFYTKYIPRHT